ncbi:MAG: hypothetical protein GOVbin4162_91 [Prokaryotic dsDNA virus sp.]|nr:MAG: hypothetical protein GOVbin4162_91 [Prokaryotic dsDNA virus sp.]|tara:strand:- start:223 stop:561 length:339 start_codon:yes stop_codon:yes gene_type:complete
MGKFSDEQLRQIIDGAYEWCNESPNLNYCGDGRQKPMVHDYDLVRDMHNVDDLKEILALRELVAELDQLAQLGCAYTDPNQCRKCGHLYNRGYCCINCGDSDPSEPKENTDD